MGTVGDFLEIFHEFHVLIGNDKDLFFGTA